MLIIVICLDLMKRLKGLRLVICDDESSESVPQQYHFTSEVCQIFTSCVPSPGRNVFPRPD